MARNSFVIFGISLLFFSLITPSLFSTSYAEVGLYNTVFEVCTSNKQVQSPVLQISSDSEIIKVNLGAKINSRTCITTTNLIHAIDQNTITAKLTNKANVTITLLQINLVSTTPSITINNVSLQEGNSGTSNYAFTVIRSNNVGAVSVNYATADNTASAASDYIAKSVTTLSFAAGGPLSQTITISVNGDTIVEPNETFFVNLSNCVGCTISDSQGIGTITNDDSSTTNTMVAGWRSSEYGNDNQWGHDQSNPAYWINVAQQMSSKFPGSTPGGVLVVGELDGAPGTTTSTFMPFPKPSGTYPNVTFGTTDAIEPLLTAYDNAGLKVYLQVESADADIPMLMDLIMNRYKQHPSVMGFGVDVEWYHQKQYPDGRPLTDSEVNSWATKVTTYNPNYSLMVKHWDWSYLSNARPSNVLFLTDSEQLGSLSNATSEYIAWIDHFGSAQVGFQIGYPSDMSWWGNLSDPASSIINPVIAARPNANIGAVYWVDFSVLKVFP
jgi:hypothetical protein